MADGSVIYYEKIGTGSPLFLLHGNGGSSAYFTNQVPELSKYFQLYLMDSRGHGKSTNTQKETSFQLMAEDLLTVIQNEGLTNVDILGFSDGANLAMVFAHLHPSYVHRLILNAGNTKVKGVRLLSRIGSVIQYIAVWLCSPFDKGMRYFLPILRLLFHDIGISAEDLQAIKSPTLVIVGKHDSVKTTHSMNIAKNIPNASFVLVKGQGHLFAKRNPKRFNQEVLAFLTKESIK